MAKKKKADSVTEARTTINTVYFVNGSGNTVVLDLLIGDPGQTSSTIVSLDNKIIAEDIKGDVNLSIGKNEDLDGKVLDITTTVLDTSKDSNHTEVIVRLRGGVIFREFPLSEDVKNEGDLVAYSMTFRLRKIN